MSKKTNIPFRIIFIIIIAIVGYFVNNSKDQTTVPIEEAILSQYNLYIKGEKSSNIPLEKNEISDVLNYSKKTTKELVEHNLSNFNIKDIPENDLDIIHQKILGISKKSNPKIKITSEEEGLASIEISNKTIKEYGQKPFNKN